MKKCKHSWIPTNHWWLLDDKFGVVLVCAKCKKLEETEEHESKIFNNLKVKKE